MDCKHQAQFSFKTLFAKKPTYTCKKCGVPLEMNTATQSISRVLNSVLIAALFFRVLSGKPAEDVTGMIMSFAVLLLFIVIYIIAYYFLVTFGKFVEKAPVEPIITDPAAPTENTPAAHEITASQAETSGTDSNSSEAAPAALAGQPALTKEQQDLIALYNSYASTDETTTVDDSSAASTSGQTNSAAQTSAGPATLHAGESCVHAPQKNWKNYIPSQFNFTCEKCGQPITFTQQTKKQVNLIIMAIIFVILMPSFMNTQVSWLQFLGLTALAVALSTAAQFYFLTKGKYIDNPQSAQTGTSRRRR